MQDEPITEEPVAERGDPQPVGPERGNQQPVGPVSNVIDVGVIDVGHTS